MKTLYSIILLMLVSILGYSQAPEAFNYQAVMRNASGDILTNSQIAVQVSILQNSESGTAVYVERFNPTTNDYGLIALKLGMGSVQSGTFNTIDWGADSYYIKIEIDPNNGTAYTSMGTSQLLSVPYALYAASGNPGPQGDKGDPGDTKWNDVTGGINYDLGNVGIGSSSPSEKLDVEGSIQIDGDLIYESVKTRYYTVSHAAFDLEVEGGSYEERVGDNNDPEVKRVQVEGGILNNLARLVAPINLPHGATITEIDALVFDNLASFDVTIRLVKQNFTGSSASAQASIAMVGTSGTPGLTHIVDGTIHEPVVDNQNFSYNLQFDTSENTSFLALYVVRITYTVSAAD